MNAANPLHVPPSQRQHDRQAEPSMEEILASIRRIIADDQAMPAAEPPPAALPPQAVRASSFRERDVEAEPAASADEAPSFAAHGQVTAPQYPSPEGLAFEEPGDDGRSELLSGPSDGSAERQALSEPDAVVAAPRGASNPSLQQDKRMRDQLARDPGHDGAYDSASRDLPADPVSRAGLFSEATDKALSSAFNMLAATRLADDSEELRAMAREMIRPLLKTWLDDNLPSLVERLVRAEIERVARGGR